MFCAPASFRGSARPARASLCGDSPSTPSSGIRHRTSVTHAEACRYTPPVYGFREGGRPASPSSAGRDEGSPRTVRGGRRPAPCEARGFCPLSPRSAGVVSRAVCLLLRGTGQWPVRVQVMYVLSGSNAWLQGAPDCCPGGAAHGLARAGLANERLSRAARGPLPHGRGSDRCPPARYVPGHKPVPRHDVVISTNCTGTMPPRPRRSRRRRSR